jgi:hypothetical protein
MCRSSGSRPLSPPERNLASQSPLPHPNREMRFKVIFLAHGDSSRTRWRNCDLALLALNKGVINLMNVFSRKLLLVCAMVGLFCGAANASSGDHAVAAATISHRVSKPGQSIELLITVRNAQPPVSALPECPRGLELKRFWRPQYLTDGGHVISLLRFKLMASAVGDYEIPPIRVMTGAGSVFTKPVILHVSNDTRPPFPDARELSLTTDIPLTLAQEAVKTCPTPASKPSPSPTPKDGRAFAARMFSTIGHGFSRFWNYPGK